eukprot:TRINITY_DN6227_c0_g2_i5.p1 TRINITY_DN6227_c0_g2~~TRINITY_DN6227_c0_g2_i5.p1  ORF type:complete len:132 (+),score=22.67 TRINITY_DN6227_c0_g2_i5:308-703(+)
MQLVTLFLLLVCRIFTFSLTLLVDTLLCFATQWSFESNTKLALTQVGGDVLIVPQAPLFGKLKQKKAQYHGLIEKTRGENLYSQLVLEFKKQLDLINVNLAKNGKVEAGVYGNRQGLKMETPGPFTHQFEF